MGRATNQGEFKGRGPYVYNYIKVHCRSNVVDDTAELLLIIFPPTHAHTHNVAVGRH